MIYDIYNIYDNLTYDVKIDGVWLWRLGGDLALIDPCISLLQVEI